MKRLLYLLWLVAGAAFAQPPAPQGTSVVQGSIVLSVTIAGENAALPVTPGASSAALTYYNAGSKTAYCTPVATSGGLATTSSKAVLAGTSWTEWNTNYYAYISCITGGSDSTTVYVYQANGPIQFAVIGSGSGGPSVTWPPSGDAVISTASNSPSGVAEVDGDCLLGSGGVWTAGSCSSAGVSSFNTRTGAVTLLNTDLSGAGGLLAANNLSDVANGYTALGNLHVSLTSAKTFTITNSLTLAGTDGSTLNIGTGGTLGSNAFTSTAYAPLASPALTGIPTAPTAAANTNTTQLATTAFVIGQGYGTGNALFGTTTGNTTNDVMCMSNTTVGVKDCETALSALALLASPTFTGTPLAPTAAVNTNTTQIATTAFVIGQGYGTGNGNAIFGTITGNTNNDAVCMSNTTVGVKDCGSALGTAAAQNTGTSGATIPLLNGTNTWSAVQSINSGDLSLKGATSGTITLNAAATAGSNTMTIPANTSTLMCVARVQTLTAALTFDDGTIAAASGFTFGAAVAMGGFNITGGNNILSNNNAGYGINGGSCITSATTLCIQVDKAQNAGIGTHGVAGDASIITGTASAAEQMYWGTGTWFAPGITPGSSAQTGDVCYNTTGLQIFLESVSCLVSLEDDKDIAGDINPAIALSEIMRMNPFYFTFNQSKHPTADTEMQAGLGARNLHSIDARLTFSDHGKLQGVRDKAVEAVLVAALQAQQEEIDGLVVVVILLVGWNVYLTVRK